MPEPVQPSAKPVRKPHHDLGAGYFTGRLDRERETRRLIAKLEAPGHQITLQPAA
jgi:transposase